MKVKLTATFKRVNAVNTTHIINNLIRNKRDLCTNVIIMIDLNESLLVDVHYAIKRKCYTTSTKESDVN